jgi:hypothetical protein
MLLPKIKAGESIIQLSEAQQDLKFNQPATNIGIQFNSTWRTWFCESSSRPSDPARPWPHCSANPTNTSPAEHRDVVQSCTSMSQFRSICCLHIQGRSHARFVQNTDARRRNTVQCTTSTQRCDTTANGAAWAKVRRHWRYQNRRRGKMVSFIGAERDRVFRGGGGYWFVRRLRGCVRSSFWYGMTESTGIMVWGKGGQMLLFWL